jgi:hypothetical protein
LKPHTADDPSRQVSELLEACTKVVWFTTPKFNLISLSFMTPRFIALKPYSGRLLACSVWYPWCVCGLTLVQDSWTSSSIPVMMVFILWYVMMKVNYYDSDRIGLQEHGLCIYLPLDFLLQWVAQQDLNLTVKSMSLRLCLFDIFAVCGGSTCYQSQWSGACFLQAVW